MSIAIYCTVVANKTSRFSEIILLKNDHFCLKLTDDMRVRPYGLSCFKPWFIFLSLANTMVPTKDYKNQLFGHPNINFLKSMKKQLSKSMFLKIKTGKYQRKHFFYFSFKISLKFLFKLWPHTKLLKLQLLPKSTKHIKFDKRSVPELNRCQETYVTVYVNVIREPL